MALKIETQPRDDHQVTLTAEIETEVFEKSKRQAARKISQESRIPGFRPGKAPYDVVKRMFGEEAIQKEAVNLLLDDVYTKVIEQAEVKPYGPGSLEEIQSMDPVTFRFLVPLDPKVELGDYQAIRKPYEPKTVEEKDVDDFLNRLRTSYATVTPAERSAQEGDLVFINVSATRVNPAEGETADLIEERPYQVTIRTTDENQVEEWPFPGFGRELLGLAAEEEKTFPHIFSTESPYEALRGVEAEFKVKVQSVKALELPELTDEFAQTLGEFQTVDELRESVRKSLEAQAKEEYDRTYFAELTDQVIEQSVIKYPPQALDDEVEQVVRNIENDLAQQSLDLDTYLKIRNTDRQTFIEEEVKPTALKRLQRSLVMDELARAENIQFDNEQFEATFSRTMTEVQNTRDFEKMRKKVPANRLANAIAMEAASRVMNNQVFSRLKAIVTGQVEETLTTVEESSPTTESEVEPPAEETSKE